MTLTKDELATGLKARKYNLGFARAIADSNAIR